MRSLVMLALVAGCTGDALPPDVTGDGGGPPNADLAVAADMAVPPDLAVAPDLATPPFQFAAPTTAGGAPGPTSIVAGRWNQDFLIDLAVDGSDGYIYTFANQSALAFAPLQKFSAGNGNKTLYAWDWNGDGAVDLVAALHAGAGVELWYGGKSFTFQSTYDDFMRPVDAVAVGDVDGQPRGDAVFVHSAAGAVATMVWAAQDDPMHWQADFPAGAQPQAAVLADLDGDGKSDLVVSDRAPGALTVLRATGGGHFVIQPPYAVGASAGALAVADFDGDGRRDVAVVDADGGRVALFRGDGKGGLAAMPGAPIDPGGAAVAVGDFDRDGVTDLAVACAAAGTVDLLHGGSGGFTAVQPVAACAGPRAVVAADLDGDDRTDLAVACHDANSIVVLRNITQ